MQHSIAMWTPSTDVFYINCKYKNINLLALNHKINFFFIPVHGACDIYQVFMTVLVSLST